MKKKDAQKVTDRSRKTLKTCNSHPIWIESSTDDGRCSGATFDMILSFVRSRSNMPISENARWLDLLLALAQLIEAFEMMWMHFVEMDDWTVKNTRCEH